jgi:hypothetical protein
VGAPGTKVGGRAEREGLGAVAIVEHRHESFVSLAPLDSLGTSVIPVIGPIPEHCTFPSTSYDIHYLFHVIHLRVHSCLSCK